MPGFADSFWSGDYASGLGVLFGKLQQGAVENQQVLAIARMRADAEEAYSQRLAEIVPATDKMSGGFSRDDGASVRKAFEGVRTEMDEASKNHRKIASNIRELVVNPFSRWCDAHESRIYNFHSDLQAEIKAHDKQADAVRKLRSHYFNKCRLVEDLEEENKLAFQDLELSPKQKNIPQVKLPEQEDPEEEEQYEIGDRIYPLDQVKKILTNMLENIPIGEAKVPILGTYQNVSTGTAIVEYIQKHLNAPTVNIAESIGQDLVGNGFLRLVGAVGNTFANSSKMNYQWRPRVFQLTGIPERKKTLERSSTTLSNGDAPDSPSIGSVGDYLSNWNPLNNPYPNETPADRLRREANEADERYKAAVRKLDLKRCHLEEMVMDHLKFMERCELDRLKAIKSVILDFSGAISNVIPSLQSTVDRMMLYQETVQPLGDLRYLLENYRTGGYAPKVQIYENYYNNTGGMPTTHTSGSFATTNSLTAYTEQTFGVDLEARARADRKRVPIIITIILTFLDNREQAIPLKPSPERSNIYVDYPDLEGDEARRGIWLEDVPLAATHHLRNAINNGKAIPHDVLDGYEMPIVASALKLYLLELPGKRTALIPLCYSDAWVDSLVSSMVYEVVKTIYATQATESDDSSRISVIQNTLGQLRLANIATLDAITAHFTRLIELTSADEAFISALAHNLAPCILRPRQDTTLTMHDRHSYRLIRDLFAHKKDIFGELKRASKLAHTSSGSGENRPRAVSTDESNRRAKMEERNRAIANRSRASSPNPNSRGHRRDRSSGGAETRFPISPTVNVERKSVRQSLDVPGSKESSPVTVDSPMNGSVESPRLDPAIDLDGPNVEKRNSLSRSQVGASSRFPRRVPGESLARQSLKKENSTPGPEEDVRPVGVSLTDRPMNY